MPSEADTLLVDGAVVTVDDDRDDLLVDHPDTEPEPASGDDERSELDLALYPDLLLLVDALERADPGALAYLSTNVQLITTHHTQISDCTTITVSV